MSELTVEYLQTLREIVEALFAPIACGDFEKLIMTLEANVNPLAPKPDAELYLSVFRKINELKPLIQQLGKLGEQLNAKIKAAPTN